MIKGKRTCPESPRSRTRKIWFFWAGAVPFVPFIAFGTAQAQASDPEKGLDDESPPPNSTNYTAGGLVTPVSLSYASLPASAIGVPEGFEGLDGPIETLFDLHFQDRRIGAVPARLEDGRLTFLDPAGVVQSLPGVYPDLVQELLEQPLSANENLVCLPGQEEGCGVLPSGSTGLIVSSENFRVDLFLGKEYLTGGTPRQYLMIGNPVSGPSVIQNIAASISANQSGSSSFGGNENFRYGIVSDTVASIGRTSAAARIIADDFNGVQAQEAYAQHFFDQTRIAAGLIQTEGSASLTGFRMYGAEVSSFSGRAQNLVQDTGTPIDVVLPRAARVEIYRDGTLLSAMQYNAGLQQLDTSRLPLGSYQIRIVAVDASGVVLDEVRTFTKAGDMPARGETIYSVRAGVRAEDNFGSFGDTGGSSEVFPRSTSEAIFSASASRRLTESASATLGITSVGDDLFSEGEVQWYRGLFKTSAALAVGPDGQYSAATGVNFQAGPISGALSARKSKGSKISDTDLFDARAYRPFLQSEESAYASLQSRLWGGNIGLRALYSRSELTNDRYAVGLNYSRSLKKSFFGNGFLIAEALTSDTETRIGIRLSFQSKVTQNGTVNAMAGGDVFLPRSSDLGRDGFFPAARLGYSQGGLVGDAAYSANVSAGASGGDASGLASGSIGASIGQADASIGINKLRGSDATDTFLTGNVQTGFVYGDGSLKLGSAGFGDAAVIVSIEADEAEESKKGRFRVVLDNQQSSIVRSGSSSSVPVPAFTRTFVGLVPIEAPAFDIDLTPREVPLFPGNVVRLDWKAVYVTSAFGRLLDEKDLPVANAIIDSESGDQATTSDLGYFSISSPLGGTLSIRRKDGSACGRISIDNSSSAKSGSEILRLGDIYCGSRE